MITCKPHKAKFKTKQTCIARQAAIARGNVNRGTYFVNARMYEYGCIGCEKGERFYNQEVKK